MGQERVPVSRDDVYCLLQACTKKKDLAACRRVHALMVSSGLDSVAVLGDHLIRLFTLCGSLRDAKQVFLKILKPSVYTWNAIISAHVKLGESEKGVELYQSMQQQGVKPDKVTFLFILKACSSIRAVEEGCLIHDHIILSGFESDLVVGNTLVDMYAKCGSLDEALKVFNSMLLQNEVSWQAIIAGYTKHGDGVSAIQLFWKMLQVGIKPGKVMFLYILKACSTVGALGHGRLIHRQIKKSALESDVVIASTLLDMYAKCGSLVEAHKVFDELPHRNVVTWGAMIAAYVRYGHCLTALELFENMQQERIEPDEVVFSCILKACGSAGAIGQGKLIHQLILRSGLRGDMVLGNTLVDMYAKCGDLEEAHKTFDELSDRDVVSWGAMITGYVQHEYAIPALELFERMQKEGIKPSNIILMCILQVCSNTGAIAQGRQIHEHIIMDGVETDGFIGNTVVDMYAKCGSLNEAGRMFDMLLNPDVVSWGAMIAGYAQHGNGIMARQYLEEMQRHSLKPDHPIFASVLLSFTYAGMLKEGCWYFQIMRDDHGFTPDSEHYNGVIDLLGRAGRLKEAEDLLHSMPIPPDTVGWRSLLTGCRTYGNVELGRRCFDQLAILNLKNASGYVLMSDIYADAYLWEDVNTIGETRKFMGAFKRPGKAWIEGSDKVHEFIVGGCSHSESDWVYAKLSRLKKDTKEEGHMPLLDSVLGPIIEKEEADILPWQHEGLATALGLVVVPSIHHVASEY